MTFTKIAAIGTLAVSALALSACNNMMPQKDSGMSAQAMANASVNTEGMARMNIVQVAQSNPDFSVLVEAVQAAGLGGMLSDPKGNYTVFAPTNDAFVQLLQESNMTKAQLFANKPLLTKVLGYHVIDGKSPIYAKSVMAGNLMTASKDTLTVTADGKLMDETGRTAVLLKTDIAANNGVVHV
ncbi:putative surface protein with fasciclin (FAS1) repeats, partial [Psychrobacter sp. PL19]